MIRSTPSADDLVIEIWDSSRRTFRPVRLSDAAHELHPSARAVAEVLAIDHANVLEVLRRLIAPAPSNN